MKSENIYKKSQNAVFVFIDKLVGIFFKLN